MSKNFTLHDTMCILLRMKIWNIIILLEKWSTSGRQVPEHPPIEMHPHQVRQAKHSRAHDDRRRDAIRATEMDHKFTFFTDTQIRNPPLPLSSLTVAKPSRAVLLLQKYKVVLQVSHVMVVVRRRFRFCNSRSLFEDLDQSFTFHLYDRNLCLPAQGMYLKTKKLRLRMSV